MDSQEINDFDCQENLINFNKQDNQENLKQEAIKEAQVLIMETEEKMSHLNSQGKLNIYLNLTILN